MKNIEIKTIESILNIEPTKEPDFIKLYLKDIGKLWELDSSSQIVFGEMLKLVTYNPTDSIHNLVIMNTPRRQKICERLECKSKSTAYVYFNRSIVKLAEKEIIYVLEKDTYLISPDICAKTNWSNVEMMKSIKLEINYEASTRTLITLVEKYPEEFKRNLETYRENNT